MKIEKINLGPVICSELSGLRQNDGFYYMDFPYGYIFIG